MTEFRSGAGKEHDELGSLLVVGSKKIVKDEGISKEQKANLRGFHLAK